MGTTPQDLLSIFQAAIDSVTGETTVRNELQTNLYPEKFHVAAIGKASDSMIKGIPDHRILSAFLVSKYHHISDQSKANKKFFCMESSHPIPEESSLIAGTKLLEYLSNLPDDEPCLFLISGGASSLLEVLDDSWDLSQLKRLNSYLLTNAFPIQEINAVRRRISKIKGGGLLNYVGDREIHCLLISDVYGNHPTDIGSGLLFPTDDHSLPTLSEEWQSRIQSTQLNQVTFNSDHFHWKIIASLDIAKKASAKKAKTLGYDVYCSATFLDSDAAEVAKDCIQYIKNHPNTLVIWGGETTVKLPKKAGAGGRNQQLALAAAIAMSTLENSHLLAAGTDGSDGTTKATGAVVSDSTIKQGLNQKMVADAYLKNADANTYLKSINALINTGPTGTNVMDLVIAIHQKN